MDTTCLVNPRLSTSAVEEQLVAEETTQNTVEMRTQVQQLLLMTERIEKLCEAAETAVLSPPPLDENVLLVKRAMAPLPLPREAVPWKRRKIIPMSRIMEEEPVLDREQR